MATATEIVERTGIKLEVAKCILAWVKYKPEGIQGLIYGREGAAPLLPLAEEAKQAAGLHLQTMVDHKAGNWGEWATIYVRGPEGETSIGGFWHA